MKKTTFVILILSPLLVFVGSLPAQTNVVTEKPAAVQAPPNPVAPDYAAAPLKDWEKKFRAFQFKSRVEDGHVLPYRLYQPAHLEPGKKYPLVVFFHGAGERGLDNRYQFFRFRDTTNFWEKHPCFIIAPQCPPKVGDRDGESTWVQTNFSAPRSSMKDVPSWPMRLAMEVLDETVAGAAVDTNRVYVTGLSMGGFATWEILQREPGRFAAAVPVCGGADLALAGKVASTPIWVLHGGADTTVLPERSRDMVAALTAAGGHPKYTEYPGVGHDAWTQTYSKSEVWDWMFEQVRK